MPDLFDKGSAWLTRQRTKHLTREVTIARASISSATVKATKGRSEYTHDDGAGMPVTVHSTDWLINVEDYSLDDIPITPTKGDRIIEGELDDGIEFEVLDIPGSGCFDYADPYRRVYRIHTKQVDTRP